MTQIGLISVMEFNHTPMKGTVERNLAGNARRWDHDHQMPDRGYAEALLDISEYTSISDQEPYAYPCVYGRESAVQGWGRAYPLACFFQPQRKGKRVKEGEPQHHCLLCLDMKLCEPPNSDSWGPESCCDFITDSQGKPRPFSREQHPKKSSSRRPSTDGEQSKPHALSVLWQATQKLCLEEEMAEVVRQSELARQESTPSHAYGKTHDCPMVKDSGLDTTLNINSFAVLPPVKSSQVKPQRDSSSSKTTSEDCATDREAPVAETGSPTAAGERRGVERGEETRAPVVSITTLPEDDGSGSLNYWSSQTGHQLFSAFIPVPKRCDVAFNYMEYPTPSSTYAIGRQLKQDSRTSSGHRLCIKSQRLKQAEPQLPILLGTRVHIPASTHRLL